MTTFTVRNYQPGDSKLIADLQHRSVAACPDMDPLPAGFYDNPMAFEGGKNIFCAFAPPDAPDAAGDPAGATGAAGTPATGEEGRLIGFGLVFRPPDPVYFYLDIKADPDLPPAEAEAVKDALLEKVVARAREIRSSLPRDAEVLLYGCYFTTGQPSLDYLAARGFSRFEPLCVVSLEHDLEALPPKVALPLGVEVRPWPLETEEDRLRYLLAHNANLPLNYLDLESLDRMLAVRDTAIIGAFHDGEVVGNSVVISENGVGEIEYLFVSEEWRGKGLGRHLVRRSLKYFQDRGMKKAALSTGTENVVAQNLYRSMGYKVVREAVSLGMKL